MNRRRALALIGTAGALAGAGLYGRHAFLAPAPSEHLDGVDELAVRLFDSMEPGIRAAACVEYDHPLRQYHNRGVWGGGISISSGTFSRDQRQILTDLMHSGLSEEGRGRLPQQWFINWPGVNFMKLLVCGDPRTSPWQIVLSGAHLNLRLGGKSREGVAFGGPQVYGDQRGNFREGLPGNIYRYQLEAARRLYRDLDPVRQGEALLPMAPIQTRIELQGRDGSFPGVAVAGLPERSRSIVDEMVGGILSTYHPDDAVYARSCIEENGGIESLFFSTYEEGEDGPSGECQIFRLEGPAAVFYFRGHPHVHAFINIAMNGEEPLSVGEILGENDQPLEGQKIKALFEEAMSDQTGTDLAYYPAESVVGRLKRGTIRTGDIYTLESWQDAVAIVEIKGSRIGGALLDQLRRDGVDLAPDRVYTVATTGYAADELGGEALGWIDSRRKGPLVRDAAIAYLRKRLAG